MTRIANDYRDRAGLALAAGFRTEAARKEALGNVSRAYDLIERRYRDKVLHERNQHAEGSDEWNALTALYDAVPMYPHEIRDRHLNAFSRYNLHEAVRELVKMRNEIKAATITPKAPKVERPAYVPGERGSCQICARSIGAKNGKIAHHGYERPGHGWQTSSCSGAMHQPYEVACDALPPAIRSAERYLEQTKRDLPSIQQRAEAETDPKEKANLRRTVHQMQAAIVNMPTTIKWLKKRLADWRPAQ